LRRGNGAVANPAMPGDPNLSGEDDIFADFGRSGEPDLRAQQRIFAHARTMANLHQVVDL
jgi:hypothetical protein